MWVSIPMGDNNIKALFTTRHGGVSSPPYDTLNLSFQRADRRENIMENYRRLSQHSGIPMDRMILTNQVHGSTIAVVGESQCGMGLIRESNYGDVDGLVTHDRRVALVTFHADCIPVYLYDPVSRSIGLVHSGWRSTLLNISAKAVRKMREAFGANPENMTAVLGPHIRQCCFEVGTDVYRQFIGAFPDMQDTMKPCGDKWYIDLSRIVARTLNREGLFAANIHDVNRCTVCEKELFFSHRGGKGSSGTGAALLMMV